MGNLESAKAMVGEPIKIDPQLKLHALDDPDLVPLWDSWSVLGLTLFFDESAYL